MKLDWKLGVTRWFCFDDDAAVNRNMYLSFVPWHRTYALMWWILSWEFDFSMYVNIIINIHLYTHCSSQRKKKKKKLPHFLIIRSFCCVWTQFRSFRFEPNFENATNPTPSKSTKPPVFPTRDLPMCFQIHQVLLLLSFRLLTSVPKRIHGINSTTIIRVCSCFFRKNDWHWRRFEKRYNT